jgi:hypothetical protein
MSREALGVEDIELGMGSGITAGLAWTGSLRLNKSTATLFRDDIPGESGVNGLALASEVALL